MREKIEQRGFDTNLYLRFQEKKIRELLDSSPDRLYIEFGGKLINDRHSARVLPGYRENAKFELVRNLCRHGEPIFVVSAKDVMRERIRGDFGIPYGAETLRVLRELRKRGTEVKHVAISLLEKEKPLHKTIRALERALKKNGAIVHCFFTLARYDPESFSPEDLSVNPFIETAKKLVLVISPGGGSGKFGVCLSQLYHEMQRNRSPRYVKFETFPVHNLPPHHPLNLAYMAASADFHDVVTRDRRHGSATSYQRDLENYEMLRVLARAFKKQGRHLRALSSATHMGINMLSRGIVDDEIVQKEAAAEIARRFVRYKFEVKAGKESPRVLERVRALLTFLWDHPKQTN